MTTAEVVDLYISRLESIIDDFRIGGFDVDEIIDRLRGSIGKTDYVTHACELSAAHYFLKNFTKTFKYQVPSASAESGMRFDPEKNFDFSFAQDNVTFNVEVKTISLKAPEEEHVPIQLFLPEDEKKFFHEKELKFSRNCAPTIGRFLKKANKQLIRPATGLSVVMLCCNSLDEYVDSLTCLIDERMGILSGKGANKIIPSPNELENIDAIVLCNLGFEHQAFFNPKVFENFYGSCDLKLYGDSGAWGSGLTFIHFQPGGRLRAANRSFR